MSTAKEIMNKIASLLKVHHSVRDCEVFSLCQQLEEMVKDLRAANKDLANAAIAKPFQWLPYPENKPSKGDGKYARITNTGEVYLHYWKPSNFKWIDPHSFLDINLDKIKPEVHTCCVCGKEDIGFVEVDGKQYCSLAHASFDDFSDMKKGDTIFIENDNHVIKSYLVQYPDNGDKVIGIDGYGFINWEYRLNTKTTNIFRPYKPSDPRLKKILEEQGKVTEDIIPFGSLLWYATFPPMSYWNSKTNKCSCCTALEGKGKYLNIIFPRANGKIYCPRCFQTRFVENEK